ncbi:MAG: hypothetical protein R2702_11625 [Acidimicrobiales bacterium]
MAAVHAAVFAPTIVNALFRPALVHPSLWVWHAARIPETFRVPWRPVQVHFGWAATSRALDAVLPTSDPRVAGAIVSLVAAAGFGVSLWHVLRRQLDGSELSGPLAALGLSLLVALLEAPAAVQGWQHIAEPLHSWVPLYFPFVPTTLASMGLNVALVWMAVRLLRGDLEARWRPWLPVTVVAAAVAKPNLTPMLVVVVPAVAVAMDRRGWWSIGANDERWRDALRLVALPAAAITFLQLVVITKLSPPRLQGSVELHPLYELRALGGFHWQYWLAALLPALAVALLGRRVVDLPVAICLGSFALGLGATLLFARAGTTPDKGAVGGDILQLAGTALAMTVIFTIRRLLVLRRAGELAGAAALVLALALVPYLVAGASTWRCHSGLAHCYPASIAGTWPPAEDHIDDP